MSFYSELTADALALLTEFGQSVTRRSYTAGSYDTATGTAVPATADSTRKGVALDFAAGQSLVRGTLVQSGDKRLLVDAVAAINMQDHFIVNGVEYVIISIGEINPAGTVVLYDLHVRA